LRRLRTVPVAAAAVAACAGSTARAQTFTADPGAWRPVAYSDLLFPSGEGEAYASIWKDRLDESNRAIPVMPRSDRRFSMSLVGNRGASEWHYSINFQTKLVALTVLDTPVVCTDEYPSPSATTRIKVCPMRLVTVEGDHYSIVDGAACYLERQAGDTNLSVTGTYAAYDVSTRAIKLRYTVDSHEVSQCSQVIALHRS
jgi:hypothetical protein